MTDLLPQPCDLLIEAGWVVPVEPHGAVLADHAVAVADGRILALLPAAEARARFAAGQRLGDQIRRHPGMTIPLEVTYSEFTPDIAENRILRTALDTGIAVSAYPKKTPGER